MNSQLKRGVVELCVMKILSNKSMSTFEVLESISSDLEINENTVYPILRRLTSDSLVEIEKVSDGIGAPRKYFQLSKDGKGKLDSLLTEWNKFIGNVQRILGGQNE